MVVRRVIRDAVRREVGDELLRLCLRQRRAPLSLHLPLLLALAHLQHDRGDEHQRRGDHGADKGDEPVDALEPRGEVKLAVADGDRLVRATGPLAEHAVGQRVRGQVPLAAHVHGEQKVKDDADGHDVKKLRRELSGVPRRLDARPEEHEAIDDDVQRDLDEVPDVEQGHARGEDDGVEEGGVHLTVAL